MRWASAVAEGPDPEHAVGAALADLQEELEGGAPQLVAAFVSHPGPAAHAVVARRLAESYPGAVRIGSSARSVIGAGREIEETPALALAAAVLPDVALATFHLTGEDLDPAGRGLAARLGVATDPEPHFVLLADPFTIDAEQVVAALDASFPGSVVVGGLASGGEGPGANALLLGDHLHREGLVGVALAGDVAVDAIVAQGCRPVGNPMFVTRCRENLLLEVDGRPPLEALSALYAGASPREQELFRSSLFLGIEMRSGETEYRQGDFLIRNLIGSDPDAGALAVAAPLRETQVVQFHLRDARTAAEDLEERLRRHAGAPPRGALLFSCLGRGRQLYGEPDHDSRALRRHLGDVPLAGFFCNGEIGPVERRTFLHGYTSSFALFRNR